MERPSRVVEELKQFVVSQAPPTVFYVPDFISEEEESYLSQQVYKSPRTKWTQSSGRRLQNWGGLPHPKGMSVEKIPDWLQNYCDRISSSGAFGGQTANHVSVNEYKPGEGIMPHEDGPSYHPTVTTVSSGSHASSDFYRPVGGPDGEAAQAEPDRFVFSSSSRPRSSSVSQDDAYRRSSHGIRERDADTPTDAVANSSAAGARPGETSSRGTRVSLTIRHVPKVIRNKSVSGRK